MSHVIYPTPSIAKLDVGSNYKSKEYSVASIRKMNALELTQALAIAEFWSLDLMGQLSKEYKSWHKIYFRLINEFERRLEFYDKVKGLI